MNNNQIPGLNPVSQIDITNKQEYMLSPDHKRCIEYALANAINHGIKINITQVSDLQFTPNVNFRKNITSIEVSLGISVVKRKTTIYQMKD